MLHLTKITAPNISGIVPRQRLFSRLDRCSEKPVIWISSPGGSGKTSLVTCYLDTRHLPHLWYKVDTGDDDIATFFYYMGLACKKASPRFRNPLPLLTPEYLPGLSVFTQRYFEELFRRLKPPFVMVLDNYQDVPEQSHLHEIVNIGLMSVPKGITVMVISRNPPPLNLARLRANNHMELIEWDDIRLSQEETKAILLAKDDRTLDDMDIALLQKKTDGWVAGLVLLIENSRKQGVEYQQLDTLTKDDIFPYFATEIFLKTDLAIRDFLLWTSFLPSMTSEMAESLTGVQKAGGILQGLYDHNFFMERRLKKSPSYLYHGLFREFLMAKALETFSDDEIRDIQMKAAGLLMESGQVEDAAALLINARSWVDFVPFVLKHAPFLMAQGRGTILGGWIDSLPDGLLQSNPWLLYWKGASQFLFNLAESRACHEQAFHVFNQNGDDTGCLLAWSGLVDTYVFECKDFKVLDRWICWIDERLRRDSTFPSIEIETSVLSSMVGSALWRQPGHSGLRDHVRRIVSIYQEKPDVNVYPQTLFFAVMYFIWMGEFEEARIVLDQMNKRAESPSSSPLVTITAKLIEANYAVANGEAIGKITQLVNEGLSLAHSTGVHFLDFLLIGQEGFASLVNGDTGLSDSYLKKLESSFESDYRISYSLYTDILSLHYLHRGNPSQSLAYAKTSATLSNEFGMIFNQGLSRLMLAQAYYELEDPIQSLEYILLAEEIVSRIGSPFLMFSCDLIKSYIYLGQGNECEGLPILRQALSAARKSGYTNAPYVWRKKVICRLCIKALEAGIETDYVRGLIQKQNLYPDIAPIDIEKWPWSVKIYSLGRFALVVNGMPVNVSGKAQKKPLFLLKALIALGARDIKEEHLADLLWPEAEGDAGHNAFTTTLSRLRKLIGHDHAIQLNNGRVSLDNRTCWVDRWAFERLCNRTETILESIQAGKSAPQNLKQIAAKAEKLYKGPFLNSDDDMPWAVAARERIRNKYLHLVGQTACFLSQSGDDETAIRYYRKGIEAEPLSENLYQFLISSYIRLDRLAEALATFKQCRKILDAHAIPLSPKTEAIKRQIHKN